MRHAPYAPWLVLDSPADEAGHTDVFPQKSIGDFKNAYRIWEYNGKMESLRVGNIPLLALTAGNVNVLVLANQIEMGMNIFEYGWLDGHYTIESMSPKVV